MWCSVMYEEMTTLVKNKIWDVIEVPEGVHLVGSKWVYYQINLLKDI